MKTPKGYEVDHINRDTLDCRRCNMRNVTHSTNMLNRADFGTLKGKFITFQNGRYLVRIRSAQNGVYGKQLFYRGFLKLHEAVAARYAFIASNRNNDHGKIAS